MPTWILVLLLCALTLSGQPKTKGKAGSTKAKAGSSVNVTIAFSNHDRAMIQQWVRSRPANGLPPGLQKNGLPPGLQKQLRRNGQLPPGLQKKITPFPSDLIVQLDPPRPGYDYVFLGGQALLVAREGHVIADVMAPF
jgi:hypothetical protein